MSALYPPALWSLTVPEGIVNLSGLSPVRLVSLKLRLIALGWTRQQYLVVDLWLDYRTAQANAAKAQLSTYPPLSQKCG